MYGKTHSEETKKKMSKANNKKVKIILNNSDILEFESITKTVEFRKYIESILKHKKLPKRKIDLDIIEIYVGDELRFSINSVQNV